MTAECKAGYKGSATAIACSPTGRVHARFEQMFWQQRLEVNAQQVAVDKMYKQYEHVNQSESGPSDSKITVKKPAGSIVRCDADVHTFNKLQAETTYWPAAKKSRALVSFVSRADEAPGFV